jgi:trehalose/maltose hydrolase-like predicted phosphorylase
MTAGIESVIASRLSRGPQSLDLFRASYRPFMRAPWDAFSEKRSSDNVYFLTGMACSLESVFYGFGGLQVAGPGDTGHGTKLAQVGDAALYADPHLPPGWTTLQIQGIHFRGTILDMTVSRGNHVTIVRKPVFPAGF